MEKSEFSRKRFKSWIEQLAEERETEVTAVHEWIADELDMGISTIRQWSYSDTRRPSKAANTLLNMMMKQNPLQEKAKAS